MTGAFLWDDRVRGAVSITSVAGAQVASMPVANLRDSQPQRHASHTS